MFRITIVLFFCLLTFSLHAQTLGIGVDAPDASSILELQSANTGVLIPRINIPNANAAAPVTTPATSLLVYNTNNTILNGNGTGYYYWNGSNWTKLLETAGDDDWYLENTTNAPTAIGDNIYTNGNVGIGIPLPLMSLHTSGEIQIGGNNIYNDQTGSGQNLNLVSVGGVSVILDNNNNGSEEFTVKTGSITGQNVFEVSEGGNWQSDGDGTISGNDLEFDGSANPANIFTNSSNTGLGLDISSQGAMDLTIDADNNNPSAEFAIKRNDPTGTAAVNKLFTIPEDFTPLVYPYGIGAGEAGGIRFRELEANGTDYVMLRSPDALSADVRLTLPDTDGNANEVLQTDGNGVLSWRNLDNTAVIKYETSFAATGPTINASWSTQFLNIIEGTNTFVSLSANQFTLQPGKYYIDAVVPAYSASSGPVSFKSRLISGAVTTKHGTVGRISSTSAFESVFSEIQGVFTVTIPTTYRIESICTGVLRTYIVTSSLFGNQVRARVTLVKIE